MSDWEIRPKVEASLLNPALIGMTIAHAAAGYHDRSHAAMPWPLAFLIPPMVLHRPTREVMPSSTRTHFATWISRQTLVVAGYPDRAEAMVEPTREALRMAIRAERLVLEGGAVVPATLAVPPAGELRQLLRASALFGKWLALLDRPSTAFALLGVSP